MFLIIGFFPIPTSSLISSPGITHDKEPAQGPTGSLRAHPTFSQGCKAAALLKHKGHRSGANLVSSKSSLVRYCNRGVATREGK